MIISKEGCKDTWIQIQIGVLFLLDSKASMGEWTKSLSFCKWKKKNKANKRKWDSNFSAL